MFLNHLEGAMDNKESVVKALRQVVADSYASLERARGVIFLAAYCI